MKIYIAGPMSGHPFGNRQAFDSAAKVIRRNGDVPINPVDLDLALGMGECFDDPDKLESPSNTPGLVQAFARCNLHALEHSDAICLLPGWQKSKGATWEAMTAYRFNLDFYEIAWGRLIPVNFLPSCHTTSREM